MKGGYPQISMQGRDGLTEVPSLTLHITSFYANKYTYLCYTQLFFFLFVGIGGGGYFKQYGVGGIIIIYTLYMLVTPCY